MELFELALGLLGGGALLALLARRLRVPYPALLALAGAALAFVPGLPQVRLDPELALALFVAPVLLDAAYDASPRDLRDNWIPVGGLVFVAVGTTVCAVALVSRWLVPDMPWAAAVALGAIVAPPDASAATAVLRQLRPPHRVMVILEGESLLNDATALLVLRAAAAAGSFHAWPDLALLLLSCLGGIVAGAAFARLYMWAAAPIRDTAVSVALQFVATFLVWILADRLGLSAIITMVAYAVTIARSAPKRTDAWHRVQSYAVWDVMVLVLNVVAFVVIGMQLRAALPRLMGPEGSTWLLVAGGVLLACILARIVWVMGYNTVVRWKDRRFGVRAQQRRPMVRPTVAGGLVISWCGMRGIVTLAAALSLPEGFPQRDLIGFAAFAVVLGTLVLQGMTLRPLIASLDLPDDRSVEQEVALARQEAARAALAELDAAPPSKARAVLRLEYEERLAAASRGMDGETDGGRSGPGALAGLQSRAVAAERRVLARLMAEGRIGDDAYHVIEAELDRAELAASV